MGTLSATAISMKDYQNGTVNLDWKDISGGGGYTFTAGTSGNNWVTVIRFTLEKACSSITFGLCTGSSTSASAASLNYKITDAEDSTLTNATASTAAEGSFTANSNYAYSRTTLTVNRTLSAGTHYLYIWTASTSTYNYWKIYGYGTGTYAVKITYEEIQGLVYVDDGTSWGTYEVYIDDGTSWVQCVPYVDDGSDWVMCS